ncbi:DNA-binding response regulator [Devosia yakushimensis]|uniref:DNA-binding response regulator n=1 Tax=Devosia yakushimensis TaxID=470028 RepID=A0ABQ5UIK0_9HYPH|nr:response regulator [Devosia yakushimensis]GLQ11443.1 DNA-binding response regulator [Devosia yakushimensis]
MDDNPAYILIVEDDRQIATLLETSLGRAGFRTKAVHDGRAMDRVFDTENPDLMLLDVMLPGEDGLSIARRMFARRRCPIIMLTAMNDETDRVVGLELGADDYIAKPFSSRELIARIRAVLRRADHGSTSAPPEEMRSYRFAGWQLTTVSRQLTSPNGEKVELTSAEFYLLTVFCERSREILSRPQLLRLTHNRGVASDDRSIDTLVSRIRRKIEPDPAQPQLLRTVRLGGYQFTPTVEVVPNADGQDHLSA